MIEKILSDILFEKKIESPNHKKDVSQKVVNLFYKDGRKMGNCPRCGYFLIWGDRYCSRCSQKIKWL